MCAPFIEWAIQQSLWQNAGNNQLKRKKGFFWLMVLEDTTSSHDSWEAKKGTGKAKASIYTFRQIPPFKNVFPVSQLLTATSLFSKFHDLWIASQTSTSLYLIHRPWEGHFRFKVQQWVVSEGETPEKQLWGDDCLVQWEVYMFGCEVHPSALPLALFGEEQANTFLSFHS